MRWLEAKCYEHNNKYFPYLRYCMWSPQSWLYSVLVSAIACIMLMITSMLIKSINGVLIGVSMLVLLVWWHFWDLLH